MLDQRRASVRKGLLQVVILELNSKRRTFIPWEGTQLGKGIWKGLEDSPEAQSSTR